MINANRWLVILAFALLSGSASAAEEDVLVQASKLLQDKKANEAYVLLAPYQSERAGEPDYDYLLGIAALDNGKPNEAIFALERVLAVKPDHLQARAEIARAFLATGEIAASKQEFETVQQQNPPQEVSATIQKYLDIIETTRTGKKTTVRSYVEAMYGHDSNVNSATSSREIAIPFFGGALVTLNENGVRMHDNFSSVAAGFNFRHLVSAGWSLIGGANANKRMNDTKDVFDTGSLDGNLGLIFTKGEDNYSAVLQLQSFAVDNNRYRDASGMTAQWQRNLDNSSQASLYVQHTYLSYPGQIDRDADRNIAGGAFARSLAGAYTPTIYIGGYGGEEKARRADRTYLSFELYGIRAGGEMKLTPWTTLHGSISAEDRRYRGQDPLFLTGRKDTQSDLKLSISHIPAPQWTITPSLGYTHNKSNIIIDQYDRTVFSISARRDF